jgi:hypothetical protein
MAIGGGLEKDGYPVVFRIVFLRIVCYGLGTHCVGSFFGKKLSHCFFGIVGCPMEWTKNLAVKEAEVRRLEWSMWRRSWNFLTWKICACEEKVRSRVLLLPGGALLAHCFSSNRRMAMVTGKDGYPVVFRIVFLRIIRHGLGAYCVGSFLGKNCPIAFLGLSDVRWSGLKI